jgi:hypothetical protein
MQTTFRMDGLTVSERPVKPWMKYTPAIITIGIVAAFALHGRIAFATAMMLYVLAKITEVLDHQIANTLGFVSGLP